VFHWVPMLLWLVFAYLAVLMAGRLSGTKREGKVRLMKKLHSWLPAAASVAGDMFVNLAAAAASG
jgi:hypothetical protein